MTAPAEELAKRLRNWELTARTYDILRVDPLSLESGATGELAFALKDAAFENTPDGSASYPVGMTYTSATGGNEQSETVIVTTSYDFTRTFGAGASLSVSDAASSAFSGTASLSFKETSTTTEEIGSTQTIATTLVRAYRLDVAGDPELLRVSPNLAKALRALPVEKKDDAALFAFFKRFGTHFTQKTLMGGVAYQRLTIAKSDFLRMLSHGIDIKGEATATFKAVKVGAGGNVSDETNQEFKRATSATRNRIDFAGGVNNSSFDTFVSTVAERPTPIALALVPLYELLIPAFFADLNDLDARRTSLREATESYLSSQGTNLALRRLRFGDVVTLEQAGTTRALRGGERFAATSAVRGGAKPAANAQWRLVRADDPQYRGEVETRHVVALENVQTQTLLDARAGSDEEYARNVGLAGTRGTDPANASVQWRLHLVEGMQRNNVVEGDIVRLETISPGRGDRTGFLFAEDQAPQRVFSFGTSTRDGALWRLAR